MRIWVRNIVCFVGPTLGLLLLAGCPRREDASSSASGGGSGGRVRVTFWHTRRGEMLKVLEGICKEFNKTSTTSEIVPEYQGGYDDLNKKIQAVIEAKSPPALAVAYESHVSEYMARGVVRPLDDLVKDKEIGLTDAELADIPQQYLESNRFRQYGNQLLSFPFTKSNLLLYYNQSLLEKAGLKGAPATWDEFESQAATLTKVIGKPALVFTSDPSTLDGMIFSHGGGVLAEDGVHTLFDQPPAIRTFELLQRMANAKTVLSVDRPDDVTGLFTGQQCAFVLDSSSGRAALEGMIGDRFKWDVAPTPHAQGTPPATVMYGPNICVFKGTPEQEREAWKFVKYFVSPEVTSGWARDTGYLPIRKSVVELPEMKEFYDKHPRARKIYDMLQIAKPEPNVVGWQEVRELLRTASRSVLTAGADPARAAAELKKKADQVVAQSQ